MVLRDFRLSCANAGVVRSICDGSMGSYGHVVQDIRARSRELRFVEFVHECRQLNVDAHNLARSCIYAELEKHVCFVFLMVFVLIMKINKGFTPLKKPWKLTQI